MQQRLDAERGQLDVAAVALGLVVDREHPAELRVGGDALGVGECEPAVVGNGADEDGERGIEGAIVLLENEDADGGRWLGAFCSWGEKRDDGQRDGGGDIEIGREGVLDLRSVVGSRRCFG